MKKYTSVEGALTSAFPQKAYKYLIEIEFTYLYYMKYRHGTAGHIGYLATFFLNYAVTKRIDDIASGEVEAFTGADKAFDFVWECLCDLIVDPKLRDRIYDEINLAVEYVETYHHGTDGTLSYEVNAALFAVLKQM